jgi:hypothetical protein
LHGVLIFSSHSQQTRHGILASRRTKESGMIPHCIS